MGQKVDLDDLVSAVEIAHRLGLNKATVVHDWRYRKNDGSAKMQGFPDPVLQLGAVHVWLWPEVERWARQTDRIR